MCPAIEDYAPYIDAVFRRPWDQQSQGESPRLPCSIADRSLMDSEPLIASFLELMQLPDSRFEVSKILDYLRLPALQQKFGFATSEIEILEWWLQEASVHWALDAKHKQTMAGLDEASATFSWQWGLERLLLGFAQADSEVIVNNQLLLPMVEGQQAVLLGRLLQLLELLKQHSRSLLTARTPEAWQDYLQNLTDSLFEPADEELNARELISKVINSLTEHCNHANYDNKIELTVVRNYLNNNFSQADSTNHFLTGQITFCSMVPMRSIPFKKIAILGLNDGSYPRQNTPLSFDLMAQQPRKQGDRSRRGDDRYLFLEALISVRETLYLSYQGRDIKNNSQRQPSLILKELMDYLELGYDWQLSDEGDSLKIQALHPFSPENYQSSVKSFDQGWLRLIKPAAERDNFIELPELEFEAETINLEALVSFYDKPLKQFAQKRLGLYLGSDNQLIEDSEPFSADNLLQYQVRENIFQQLQLSAEPELIKKRYQLSGELPETPFTKPNLELWQTQASILNDGVNAKGKIQAQIVELPLDGITLQASLPFIADNNGKKQLLTARSSSCKAKDELRLWLLHLVATISSKQAVQSIGLFLDNKKMKLTQIEFEPLELDTANQLLITIVQNYKQGFTRPSLWHCNLGRAIFATQKLEAQVSDAQAELTTKQLKAWYKAIKSDQHSFGLDSDIYFNWFYQQPPKPEPEIVAKLQELYQPLYTNLKGA